MPRIPVPLVPRDRALPPLPPPTLPTTLKDGENGEGIYVSSCSVIELDCPSTNTNTDGSSDSGIYNVSTDTGSSTTSSVCVPREVPRPACTSMLTRHELEEFLDGYEEQEVCVWVDCGAGEEDLYSTQFVYESIYEEIPTQVSRVKVDNGKDKSSSGLTKKIKKLRRSWSLRKDDISRGLNKIKRSSKNLIEDSVYWKEARFTSVGSRRKISLSQLLSTDQPELRDNGEDVTTVQGSTFYTSVHTRTVTPPPPSSPPPTPAPSTVSPTQSSIPVAPRRRRSGKTGRVIPSVVRPIHPPPPPPSLSPAQSPAPVCPPLPSLTTPAPLLEQIYTSPPYQEQTYTSRLFLTEPLYQFYQGMEEMKEKQVKEKEEEEIKEKEEEGLLGEIEADPAYQAVQGRLGPPLPPLLSCPAQRSLWAELPQVLQSGILPSLSPQVRKLQEAAFEILSSEASYLKSLNVLVFHFASSAKFSGEQSVISQQDKNVLFSNVLQVRSCSERFLEELEKRWQDSRSVLLPNICDLLLSHTRHHFPVYIDYCAAQPVMDTALKQLRRDNLAFAEVLEVLESSPTCQGLSLYSFLMLPMQRITRLPLLTSALVSHLNHDQEELAVAKEALEALTSLVGDCNEAARREERREELIKLSRSLDWRELVPPDLHTNPPKFIVKSSPCTKLSWRDNPEKLTFGRKGHKQSLQLLLLSDLLIVCKKKSEGRLCVLDYCPRNLVSVTGVEPGAMPGVLGEPGTSVWLTLLQNCEQRTQEMLLTLPTISERDWWLNAVFHTLAVPQGGKVDYQPWDRPRVEAVETRVAESREQIGLTKGEQADVISRKDDGWMYLEKCQGSRGWVPSHVLREIESSHRRAKNFHQRYQFLQSLAQSGD